MPDAQKPEIEDVIIVLLGNFNPSIFQPTWFALKNLIRQEEAEQAKIELVHNEVTAIAIQDMKVRVTREQFSITTTVSPNYEVCRDLVAGTFKVLCDTPVKALGINWEAHYKTPNEDTWHAMGHSLAPKRLWSTLESPGLISMSMRGKRTDEYEGAINVRVEPSRRMKYGVFFHVNDHYDTKPEQGCETVIDILESSWEIALKRAQGIVSDLFSKLQMEAKNG